MSNSALVSTIFTGSTKYGSRTKNISKITIHHAAGVVSLESLWSIMNSYADDGSPRKASWNYGISNDGQIGLYIEEKHRAWTSRSTSNDNVAVTIEVSNSSNSDSNWPISGAAYTALLYLVEDICRRNGISYLNYTGDASGNLTRHNMFADTTCPGPYLQSKFPQIVTTVNQRLKGPDQLPYVINPSVTSTSAAGAAITGGVVPVDQLLDWTRYTPYLAIVDRTTPSMDYNKLKDAGVIGVMVEAGYLYDTVHMQVPYRNPKLDNQIQAVETSGLPFGLYATTKARSVVEARKELLDLSYVIYNRSPALGIWLEPALSSNVMINDSIIKEYKERFIELGLKQRMGLYATLNQLQRIRWSKHFEDWYLWLNRPVADIDEINQLLTPSFFNVDMKGM